MLLSNTSIDTIVKINFNKEKRAMINCIKKIINEVDAIEFGGGVRDSIISQHYTNEFFDKNTPNIANRYTYWNTTVSPETSARTLVPNDIDVYFSNIDNYNNFINKIKYTFTDATINIKQYNISEYTGIEISEDLTHNVMKIIYTVGKTFVFNGYKIILKIDMITLNSNNITIEPPFNNCDMLCNILIRDKNGIRLSKNTGTDIDYLTEYKKSQLYAKIMKNIINFETDFCSKNDNINSDIYNCRRILNMINKPFHWTINNSPFNIIKKSNDNDVSLECVICKEYILNSIDLIQITSTKNLLHRECFNDYIQFQLSNPYKNKDGKKIIRCPYRTEFNFSDCYKCLDLKNYI